MSRNKRLGLSILLCLSLLATCLIFTGCGETADAYKKIGSSHGNIGISTDDNGLSYAEIGKKLSDMEIGGVTDDVIERLIRSDAKLPTGAIYSKTARMLSELGFGNYDVNSGVWSPSDNGVYSFDAEFLNYKKMYSMFIDGLSSIGGGELDFESVSEDLSKVNWEFGGGTRSVSFSWRDKTYTVEAEYTGKWINYKVINQINEIIKSADTGKCLYFGTDGYQDIFVFYRDEKWKKRFEEETGIKLSEKISD